jgi:hypothetical protein
MRPMTHARIRSIMVRYRTFMPRKRSPADPEPLAQLTVAQQEAEKRISARIEAGEEIRTKSIPSPDVLKVVQEEYYRWDSFNGEMLDRLFSTERFAREYRFFGIAVFSGPQPFSKDLSEFLEHVSDKIHRLTSIRECLPLIPAMAGVPDIKQSAEHHGDDKRRVHNQMNCKVFISHAVVDIKLAEALHDVLDHGFGINPAEIFRSSAAGSIASGEDFIRKILGALSEADYVICVVTPGYLDSQFCIAELGISQNRNLVKTGLLHGLVVEPATFKTATAGVLVSTQLVSADNLNDIKEVLKPLRFIPRTDNEWDRQYSEYKAALNQRTQEYRSIEALSKMTLTGSRILNPGPGVFTNKLYISLKNEGTSAIRLKDCTFDPGPHGVALQPRDPAHLLWRQVSGGVAVGAELTEIDLVPGGVLESWIGLDPSVMAGDVLDRMAGKRLGTLSLRDSSSGEVDLRL